MTHVLFMFDVLDASAASAYAQAALPLVSAHGGTLVGTAPAATFFGASTHSRSALFSFPDRESAERWHSDPAYQALLALRGRAMDCVVHILA
ncbi:DUF1330 domain-containing protein [Luteibacter sp. 621]|uniref:DUF1330 domain-containing protein n=1 Tax=Luteibacter sp. 621 TaxID=3373916 RepID=UPI003D246D06